MLRVSEIIVQNDQFFFLFLRVIVVFLEILGERERERILSFNALRDELKDL